MIKKTLGALAIITSFGAHCQAPFYVQATAKDPVGRQIVYELREGIRRSAAMTLADRAQDARMIIRLVTMDPNDGESSSGHQTIYSAVFTLKTYHDTPVEMYLTNYVGVCGVNRSTSCAQGLVATADDQVTNLKAILRNIADESAKNK